MQGGVGDCTRELGRALIGLKHQVAVVTSVAPSAPGKARANEENASVIHPAISLLKPSLLEGSAGLEPSVYPVVARWNWGSWGHVLETVRTQDSDILHIEYQTAGYGMHPAINLLPLRLHLGHSAPRFRYCAPRCWRGRRGSKQGPQVVVTFHDLRVPYLFPKAGPVRKWVTLALARWSDAVIATNIEDYQSLQSLAEQRRPSLHLIPIGSNIQPRPSAGYDRAAWRHSLGLSDELLLCYFGFLNESKGGETLFRALAELVRRGRRVRLLMIGGQVGDSDPTNVAYAEHIRALSTELGLQELVLWTGYTDAERVSANLFAADVCVLPYRDGASYRRGSFMAALAHGLPIVSTRPRAQIDSLVDGDNILLVPADDPLATADAVERLASKPELRACLARGALQLAQRFTWDSIASQTAQVYAELLGE
jgi:glycosyltransferase involved in cell wall biosynthesis